MIARLFACAGGAVARPGRLRVVRRGGSKFRASPSFAFCFRRPRTAPLALGLPRPADRILDDAARFPHLLRLLGAGGEAAGRADLVGKDLRAEVSEDAEQVGGRLEQAALG